MATEGSFTSYALFNEFDASSNDPTSGVVNGNTPAFNNNYLMIDEPSQTVVFFNNSNDNFMGSIRFDGTGYVHGDGFFDRTLFDPGNAILPQQHVSALGTYVIIEQTLFPTLNDWRKLAIFKKGALLQTLDFSSKFDDISFPAYAISKSGQYIVAAGGKETLLPTVDTLKVIVYRGSG